MIPVNRMHARLLTALPFVFLFVVIGFFVFMNPLYDRSITQRGHIVNGKLSLASNRYGITDLHGNWSFWWKRFVTDSFSDTPDGYAPFPGSWRYAGIKDRFGYASYGLAVSGLDPAETYAIRIGQTLSACNITINGIRIVEIGTVGTARSDEIPCWNSVLARFSPQPDGTADIVVQISNYRDRTGGSNASIYIGSVAPMSEMEDSQRIVDSLVFSVLTVLGLFFLVFFLFQKTNSRFMWFSGICVATGFRTLCYDGFSLLNLFPALPWPILFRLGYLTLPIIIVSFLGFLQSLYPTLLTRRRFIGGSFIFIIYSVVIIFAPEFITANLLHIVQVCAICAVVGGIVVIILAGIRGKSRSWVLLVAFSFAVATFGYDMLVSMWVLSGFSFGALGMCFCLFFMAFLVIEFYASSFETTRILSEQLRAMNKSLRRFVPAEFLACLNKEFPADIQPGDCVEVDMAIMSSDIRSFSAIAEKLPPNDVFAFLNEYLELVGPVIRSNGGFIARYEGDGFLALFPSGAEDAVRCAVQMQSAITGRNRMNPGKNQLSIGIGIDSGKLTLGTIGDDLRVNGAVISNCVKCAGIFESATKEFLSRILISDAVFLELYDPLAWFLRPVDRVDVGDRVSFLFEVYNNDHEILRELKWKTQDDLERSIFSFYAGRYDEARTYLSRAIAIFPDDPVIRHYARRFQM